MGSQWTVQFQGRSYPIIGEGEVRVGKLTKNELPIDCPKVSRHHGRFFVKGDNLHYEDLQSKNGSVINGIQVDPNTPVEILSSSVVNLSNAHQLQVVQHLITEKVQKVTLEDLINDESVSEILINGASETWVERDGYLEQSNGLFKNDTELRGWLRSQLAPIGRKVDFKEPYVDARLANGSRLCAVIVPAAVDQNFICIRKFSKQWADLEFLRDSGSLSTSAFIELSSAIKNKKNIVICGATGTGKTTLLNALARTVPHYERIVSIEDVAELNIEHPHVVRLESRPPNLEGEGKITIRELLKVALRMRPDRLIIGECRGDEVLDLLQALNTGHAGSLSTVHANSPRDALLRLELLCMLSSSNFQSANARAFIASSVDFLVDMKKINGKRVVDSICEISGIDDNTILLRKLC